MLLAARPCWLEAGRRPGRRPFAALGHARPPLCRRNCCADHFEVRSPWRLLHEVHRTRWRAMGWRAVGAGGTRPRAWCVAPGVDVAGACRCGPADDETGWKPVHHALLRCAGAWRWLQRRPARCRSTMFDWPGCKGWPPSAAAPSRAAAAPDRGPSGATAATPAWASRLQAAAQALWQAAQRRLGCLWQLACADKRVAAWCPGPAGPGNFRRGRRVVRCWRPGRGRRPGCFRCCRLDGGSPRWPGPGRAAGHADATWPSTSSPGSMPLLRGRISVQLDPRTSDRDVVLTPLVARLAAGRSAQCCRCPACRRATRLGRDSGCTARLGQRGAGRGELGPAQAAARAAPARVRLALAQLLRVPAADACCAVGLDGDAAAGRQPPQLAWLRWHVAAGPGRPLPPLPRAPAATHVRLAVTVSAQPVVRPEPRAPLALPESLSASARSRQLRQLPLPASSHAHCCACRCPKSWIREVRKTRLR